MEVQLHSALFLLALMTIPLLFLPSIPTPFQPLLPARQKKRYKRARKSKWSNGVIRKPKKKKPPVSTSNTSSSTSSKANSDSSAEEIRGVKTRAVNGSSGLSSSSMSDSSDEEQNRRLLNAITRAQSVLTNGFSHPKLFQLAQRNPKHRSNLRPRNRSSEAAPAPPRASLNKLGLYD